MFPVTDSRQTIIDCLLGEARKLGVKNSPNAGVEAIERAESGSPCGWSAEDS